MPYRYLSLLLLLLPMSAGAGGFTGRIVQVVDGDSLVIEADRQRRTVHLMGIDAPERLQDFGDRSQNHLAGLAFNRAARADCRPTAAGQPLDCRVWVTPGDCAGCGQTLDLGHAQIIAGMAWRHPDPQSYQDEDMRGRYQSSELMAQMRRLGLWGQRSPQPPWQWRQRWGIKGE